MSVVTTLRKKYQPQYVIEWNNQLYLGLLLLQGFGLSKCFAFRNGTNWVNINIDPVSPGCQ